MLERRLQRQSDILHRAGKQDLARLARAAADGLDPDRGLSPDEHPFIRAMVLSSFFKRRPPPPRRSPRLAAFLLPFKGLLNRGSALARACGQKWRSGSIPKPSVRSEAGAETPQPGHQTYDHDL